MTRRWLSVFLLLAILGRTDSVYAQRASPDLRRYTFPGETAVTLDRSLRYNGRLYQIHYFTTGNAHESTPGVIGNAAVDSFERNAIAALLVTEDS